MSSLMWVPVLGYLLLVLGIGVYASRRIRSTSDYIVAGRHLKPLVLAATLAATGIGGGATLGVAGNSYGRWGASSFWYGAAMGIAFILMSAVAPLLRRSGVRTVPEFFRHKYGRTSSLIHGLMTILSCVGMTAVQLKASATVIEVMGGVDYNTALLIVGVVITVYSVMGGFWSVALTDGIQLVLIFLGMGAAIPFTVRMAGGWGTMVAALPGEALEWTTGIGGISEILAYVILFFAAYLVGEEVASSYYAAENARTACRGSLLAGVITLLFSWIPMVLGLLILSMYRQELLGAGVVQALNQDAKYALPALAVSSMPAPVAGVLFAGILAATMSSADSALLGAGSVFGSDIYKAFIRRDAAPEKVVAVTRVSMVYVMVLSFFTAIYGGSILTILTVSLALRAAGAFIPYLMGHLWNRCSEAACVLSMLLGTGVYIAVQTGQVVRSVAGALYPALAASGAAYFLVTFLVYRRPERRRRRRDPECPRRENREAL